MVGGAMALWVLAGATQLFINHLASHNHMVERSRAAQELRAAADVMARDLRRAGHWGGALAGVSVSPMANAYQRIVVAHPEAASAHLSYAYARDDGDDNNIVNTTGNNESFGFELRDGVVRTHVGGTSQELTDAGSLRVTGLSISPTYTEVSLGDRCFSADYSAAPRTAGCCRPHEGNATLCKPPVVRREGTRYQPDVGIAPGAGIVISPACPERVVRQYDIVVRGHARHPSTRHEIEASQSVLVRNDEVLGVVCP